MTGIINKSILEFMAYESPVSTGQELNIEGDALEKYNVWNMPLHFFSFNKRNGRFHVEKLKKMQELNISDENDLSQNVIESLILDSAKDKNKTTKNHIAKYGQEKPIIATKEGVIIDGNRRYFLIKTLYKETQDKKYESIKVIILKNNYENEEIDNLESKIQFIAEERVDYSPLNKKSKIYRMIKEKMEKGLSESKAIKEISNMTGLNISEIKKSKKELDFLLDHLKENNMNEWDFYKYDQVSDQITRIISGIEVLKNTAKSNEIWFKENLEKIVALFKETSFLQLKYDVKALGSFREITPTKKNLSIFKKEIIFHEWVDETNKIIQGCSDQNQVSTKLNNLNSTLSTKIDNLSFENKNFSGGKSIMETKSSKYLIIKLASEEFLNKLKNQTVIIDKIDFDLKATLIKIKQEIDKII